MYRTLSPDRDARFNTLFWPLDKIRIPDAGRAVPISGTLRVQGHARLKAKAQLRLKPFDSISQDRALLLLPSVLRSAPEWIQPLEFTYSRNMEPGHTAIELILDNAADYSEVTRETPLVLHPATQRR